jgi:protein ImuB
VKPRHTQNGLFLPLAPEPEKLEITLARVASLVGEENVGSPRIPDTHRPGAFTMERFHPEATTAPARPSAQLALRIFRPPRPARVRLASGHPQFITAGEIQGAIISHAGPWRTSGDWWTSDPWDRDEWDIELSDGALYLLICEPRGWFLQGSYD